MEKLIELVQLIKLKMKEQAQKLKNPQLHQTISNVKL